LNIELHCHTVFSMDGLISIEALVRTAELLKLDAIAITDHDTFEGALECERWVRARSSPLLIIKGEERTLTDGSHFIGLFLQEAMQAKTLPEAIAEIEGQGGLCVIPHPFRKKDGLLRNGLEPLELFHGRRAGWEIFNGKLSAADNRRAQKELPTSFCATGGSDAHYESDLGESMNVVPWQGDSKATILAMFGGEIPFRIMGKRQSEVDGERKYAPLYYRLRKYMRVPKPLLPLAKASYRVYRNRRFGVGPKSLVELYGHQ
jgi:hypothetical protein